MVQTGYPRLSGLDGISRVVRHFFFLAAFSVAVPCVAQEAETLTLHAYANRIQVPVLVLGANGKRVARSVADRLTVSIDSGPRFHPEHVRREGDHAALVYASAGRGRMAVWEFAVRRKGRRPRARP